MEDERRRRKGRKKDLEKRAEVVRLHNERKKNREIGDAIGFTRQRAWKILDEENVERHPRGKKVIYQRAQIENKPVKDFLEEELKEKKPGSLARELGVSPRTLENVMAEENVRPNPLAPRKKHVFSDEGKKGLERTIEASKSRSKISDKELENEAKKIKSGEMTQEEVATKYGMKQGSLSRRLKRSLGFQGKKGPRGKKKNESENDPLQ